MKTHPHTKLLLPPISSAADAPLYQQVANGIKREISEGRLTPGSALPSFRALAEELLVSIITVKRAYEELEREGIIYRKQGLGTFVADGGDERTREARLEHAEDLLRKAIEEARHAGLDDVEMLDWLRTIVDTEHFVNVGR
ncbi:MAG: hypothetical protein AMXMBFR4_01830 [Candidatus Hydrogenedentota bacterium]